MAAGLEKRTPWISSAEMAASLAVAELSRSAVTEPSSVGVAAGACPMEDSRPGLRSRC